MTTLYAYSLFPVVTISLLLFFTVALRRRNQRGLAAYCAAIAVWAGCLLVSFSPLESWSEFGLKMSAVGSFVVAGYLHAAYDLTGQDDYRLVAFAYVAAAAITAAGVAVPGLLYDPVSLAAGPMFWPAMGLAVVAAGVPFWHLADAYRESEGEERDRLRLLFAAGLIGYLGAWSNAAMLAYDVVLPYGLFLVLGSLLVLATLVQSMQTGADRKLFERSLLYSAATALLSAGFLFGALVVIPESAAPAIRDYGLGALFLLCMAALAFEPIRQHIQEFLARRFFGDRIAASELADELATQEQRADQAERLAELGTFTSAIAHEVRNPLGVLSAQLRVLERRDVDPASIAEMRSQIDRAGEFLDDLLDYGRPRPLELRMVDLSSTVELAASSAADALDDELTDAVTVDIDVDSSLTIEADQGQLLQVFVVLIENAYLAIADADERIIRVSTESTDDRVCVIVDDSGPGVDEAVADELFEPFVTTRKREEGIHGTGLGLAIARNVVERHGGTIDAADSPLGGARFTVDLPKHQDLLATASTRTTTDD